MGNTSSSIGRKSVQVQLQNTTNNSQSSDLISLRDVTSMHFVAPVSYGLLSASGFQPQIITGIKQKQSLTSLQKANPQKQKILKSGRIQTQVSMSSQFQDSDNKYNMERDKTAKFQKELINKIPNDPIADNINKNDYFRYLALIKKEQVEIQKDTLLHKALNKTALSLTLNQGLIQSDMNRFNRKSQSDDVTVISNNKKSGKDFKIKNEKFDMIDSHFDNDKDTIQKFYGKIQEFLKQGFAVVQHHKTGQIYAVDPSAVPQQGFHDDGKETQNVLPTSWGSMKVAQITNSGDLVSVDRLVTSDDIQKVLQYIYFLEAQFLQYDNMISQEVKEKQKNSQDETQQILAKIKSEIQSKYLKKLTVRLKDKAKSADDIDNQINQIVQELEEQRNQIQEDKNNENILMTPKAKSDFEKKLRGLEVLMNSSKFDISLNQIIDKGFKKNTQNSSIEQKLAEKFRNLINEETEKLIDLQNEKKKEFGAVYAANYKQKQIQQEKIRQEVEDGRKSLSSNQIEDNLEFLKAKQTQYDKIVFKIESDIQRQQSQKEEYSERLDLSPEFQMIQDIALNKEHLDKILAYKNQIDSLILMLQNQQNQNLIDKVEDPGISNLFDYDDQRITRLWEQVIERRKNEMIQEEAAKKKYLEDMKRINFLKFLKRNKHIAKLNLSEKQFLAIQERLEYHCPQDGRIEEIKNLLVRKDLTLEELDSIKSDIGYQMLSNLDKKITQVSQDRDEKGISSKDEKEMIKQTQETIKNLKQNITNSQIADDDDVNEDVGEQFQKFVKANTDSDGNFHFDDEVDCMPDFDQAEPYDSDYD